MEARSIGVTEILRDLRSGAPDHELKEKYRLSVLGLHDAFLKLVAMGLVSRGELEGRVSSPADTVEIHDMRSEPRCFVVFWLPIYDREDPTVGGLIHDASENGLKVSGIPTDTGESRSFVIPAEEFADIFPFAFRAICRWTVAGDGESPSKAGFEITEIAGEALAEYRKLLGILAYGAKPV